jgi:Ykl077w/Psg1 (Pma1 Stabilization in Golgi)
MSDPMPKERGLTLVTIDPAWLDGWDQLNLTLFWVAYDAGSSSSSSNPYHLAYNVTIVPKPSEHLPANIHKGKPSTESLVIALPIVLGFILLLVVGLFIGMRAHRRIGLGSIMGRGRHGYGTNKSRRQRLGIKKGAIRLEDREALAPPSGHYRDRSNDDITPIPRQEDATWSAPPGGVPRGIHPGQHQRDVSLGSLVTDGSARNSFRTDGRP